MNSSLAVSSYGSAPRKFQTTRFVCSRHCEPAGRANHRTACPMSPTLGLAVSAPTAARGSQLAAGLPPVADECCCTCEDFRVVPKPDHVHRNKEYHYSITSSALTSNLSGMVSPSALAVLRLMISSNLVATCTGRSAGFSPLRTRSIYPAARRNCSLRTSP
jgi:hypothetical protein